MSETTAPIQCSEICGQIQKERNEAKAVLQMCGSRAQMAELERDQLRADKNQLDILVVEFSKAEALIKGLRTENERLREALEKIASADTGWRQIAQQALSKEKGQG